MNMLFQKYWTPIFAFSVWLSTSVLAFLTFNIQMKPFDDTPTREVAGWTAISTALACAILLSLPRWLELFRRRSTWAILSLACIAILVLNVYAYFSVRKDWTCSDQKYNLTMVSGIHEMSCQDLLEGTGRDFEKYFSDQSARRETRFTILAALYILQWVMLTAVMISIFHANNLRLGHLPRSAPHRAAR